MTTREDAKRIAGLREQISCILTIQRPDEFAKVVDYWNKGGDRPSREIAGKGLFELVETPKPQIAALTPTWRER